MSNNPRPAPHCKCGGPVHDGLCTDCGHPPPPLRELPVRESLALKFREVVRSEVQDGHTASNRVLEEHGRILAEILDRLSSQPPPLQYPTTAEVAFRYRRKPETISRRASELGGWKEKGQENNPRAEWWFHWPLVEKVLGAPPVEAETDPPTPTRLRPRKPKSRTNLLPVKDEAA